MKKRLFRNLLMLGLLLIALTVMVSAAYTGEEGRFCSQIGAIALTGQEARQPRPSVHHRCPL